MYHRAGLINRSCGLIYERQMDVWRGEHFGDEHYTVAAGWLDEFL